MNKFFGKCWHIPSDIIQGDRVQNIREDHPQQEKKASEQGGKVRVISKSINNFAGEGVKLRSFPNVFCFLCNREG